MIVAIDGPAGAGKSSVASCVAKLSGMIKLNTGDLYRAVTLKSLQERIPWGDTEQLIACVRKCHLGWEEAQVTLDGRGIASLLHTQEVDERSALLSSIVPIRRWINEKIRTLVKKGGSYIVEGRDITTVVFPDADVKIFLDASLEIRAQRRHTERAEGLSLEEIKGKIAERDYIDSHKKEGSLARTKDVTYIETSSLTLEEVCARVLGEIRGRN